MKIKGFGGVFWRTRDVQALSKWYEEVLGINMQDWHGAIIKPEQDNETIFSFFKEESNYFPKEQSVMLNFQVESISDCIAHLESLNIKQIKDPEKSEYGTFIWIADPDGRWIELWEK